MNWKCKLGIHDYFWKTSRQIVSKRNTILYYEQQGTCLKCGKMKFRLVKTGMV